jgi:hypothetical protein
MLDALKRLHYWRSNPTMSDAIQDGNELATANDNWQRLKGFLKIDGALTRANVELMVLKRLNYVSLWTTINEMRDDDDRDGKAAIKEAKVRCSDNL